MCIHIYTRIQRKRERERESERQGGRGGVCIHERRIDSRYGYNKGEVGEEKRREEARDRPGPEQKEKALSFWCVCVRAREPSVGSCCTLGPDTAPTLHRASPSWTLVEFVEFRATNENRENVIYRPARTNVLEWTLYKRREVKQRLESLQVDYASFLKMRRRSRNFGPFYLVVWYFAVRILRKLNIWITSKGSTIALCCNFFLMPLTFVLTYYLYFWSNERVIREKRSTSDRYLDKESSDALEFYRFFPVDSSRLPNFPYRFTRFT